MTLGIAFALILVLYLVSNIYKRIEHWRYLQTRYQNISGIEISLSRWGRYGKKTDGRAELQRSLETR